MTELKQIYKCELCGNVVEVLHTGMGQLICCGQAMGLFEEKSEDVGNEKHVPIFEQVGNEVKVKVGLVPHPMEAAHYIEFIELFIGDKMFRKFLKSGEKPEAVFKVEGTVTSVRAYCNIHGLWKQ